MSASQRATLYDLHSLAGQTSLSATFTPRKSGLTVKLRRLQGPLHFIAHRSLWQLLPRLVRPCPPVRHHHCFLSLSFELFQAKECAYHFPRASLALARLWFKFIQVATRKASLLQTYHRFCECQSHLRRGLRGACRSSLGTNTVENTERGRRDGNGSQLA